MHFPRHKLGEAMNQEALQVLQECDLILFIADLSQPPDDEDRLLAGLLAEVRRPIPRLLVLNKMDLVNGRRTGQPPGAVPGAAARGRADRRLGPQTDEGLERLVARLQSAPA